MDYKPDGIIVTIPMIVVEENGGEKILERYFEQMNFHDDWYWSQGLGQSPKYEVLYLYLLWNGLIRYRLNISHSEVGTREFKDFKNGGFRSINKKHWFICTAPVIKAPKDFIKKGFQGFRYTQELF